MTTPNHTPTPWYAKGGQVYSENTGRTVALLYSITQTDDANAALIVRAVNAHEALVRALEAIVARIVGEYDHPSLMAVGPLLPNTQEDVKRFAQAALRAAKGE